MTATPRGQTPAHDYGSAVAQRYPTTFGWRERTFAELGTVVERVAGLLHAHGVRRGDRVALLARTRPEWTVCDLAITRLGAVCVPVYPTSTPRQAQWVLHDSGAGVAIVEGNAHVEMLTELRAGLPALHTVLAIDEPTADGDSVAQVMRRAVAAAPPPVDVDPDDPFTIVYTSGTTGDPKGCVLTHRNLAAVLDMVRGLTDVGPGDVLFAYLPLAHLLTRTLQMFCLHTGATIAYAGGDIRAVLAELTEVGPTHLPSVPTLFEKIYSVVTAQLASRGADERAAAEEAIEVGRRVRLARAACDPVDDGDERRFAAADERLFALVRSAFGGRVKQALTGAAPIAPEILDFFFACGVPVYEAYGMTESTAVISANVPGAWRPGTVGRPVPGVEVRIAEDGEVCARSAGIFAGYWNNDAATAETIVDGWLHTGDLGALDADGFLTITGRKKDIIITSAGKNLTPANLENDLRRSPWIAEAVMLGARRPYPVLLVTLDPDHLAAWARETGAGDDCLDDPGLRALLAAEIEAVNARYSPPERVRDFAVVAGGFSVESGELTPTLKVRRATVAQRHAALVDAMYAPHLPTSAPTGRPQPLQDRKEAS